MAIPARLVVSLRHASRIEAGSVRADAPPDRRMALHAVTLRVTRGAALQPLARGLPVLEQPDRLGVVKRDVAAPRRRGVRGLVTVLAEHLGVVAARAIPLTRVRLRRVPDDEVRRMESALALSSVAIAAELACVTPFAGELAARGRGAVRGEESAGMHAYQHRFYRRGRRGRRGSFNSRSFSVASAISSHRPIRGGDGRDSLLGVATAQLHP